MYETENTTPIQSFTKSCTRSLSIDIKEANSSIAQSAIENKAGEIILRSHIKKEDLRA